MKGTTLLKIYFDGGCRPNPGTMETAVVTRGRLDHRTGLGPGTSEQAEWCALLHALDVARQLGARDVLLLGDAAGVVDQATGKARCRSPGLRDHFEQAAQDFDRVRVRYVRRNQNLAGIALGQARQRRRMSDPTVEEPLP